jgi:hypothetical protein
MTKKGKADVVGVEPWDTGKAAQLAADALRYLGCNAREVLRGEGATVGREMCGDQAR